MALQHSSPIRHELPAVRRHANHRPTACHPAVLKPPVLLQRRHTGVEYEHTFEMFKPASLIECFSDFSCRDMRQQPPDARRRRWRRSSRCQAAGSPAMLPNPSTAHVLPMSFLLFSRSVSASPRVTLLPETDVAAPCDMIDHAAAVSPFTSARQIRQETHAATPG